MTPRVTIYIVRRLLPGPDIEIDPAEAMVDPRRRRVFARPWVGLCMVSSIDGATAVEGRSGGLSSPTDTAVLVALRGLADVVLVGAETVRAEDYGPPKRAGLRVGVVTRQADRLDWDSALFASGAAFVVTTESAPPLPVPTVRAGSTTVDFTAALAQIDATVIHVEGGPRLNGALFDAAVVDEVNLTVSPHLVGGDSARIISDSASALRRFRLAHILHDADFLFLRYLAER